MQITGSQFTNTVALYGNDLATLPDFPAEIRAPAGTLPGRQRIPGAFFFAATCSRPATLSTR